MRRRTLSRDESPPLLTMEQQPPTKEKLAATSATGKIPLTMSIENLFPPVPVTEAPVPDESDHVLAFGCVDLGYAYVRDTKENVRRRSSRRSSVDVEAPSGAAAEGVV